jgi:GTPase Era involved in 16S rRNA processing
MSSYISSLNLLGDDSPIPISEEALSEELALWANAQFTFDTKPGSALPDESYKTVAEQQELFATLATLNDNNNNTQLLYDNLLSSTTAHSTLLNGLPRLAPAPQQQQNFEKLPIQSLNKEPVKATKKRKASALPKEDELDEDKRKRNTAASARFRMKKKLREQVLEKTAKEMTLKAEALEKKVVELEKEAKWLRALVVEKDPSLLQ